MTSKTTTKVPARGQAWSGDWQQRVFDRLHKRGFADIGTFADARPAASLIELADELSIDEDANIDYSDVASEQVARLWHEETTKRGAAAIERMARRVLVGELRRGLPEGWSSDWTESKEGISSGYRVSSAATQWMNALGKENKDASERIFAALLEEGRTGGIPRGWLPESADDPILLRIFQRHWNGDS